MVGFPLFRFSSYSFDVLCMGWLMPGYPADNEEMMIFWIGTSASPQLLKDLFGVDDIEALSPYMVRLRLT